MQLVLNSYGAALSRDNEGFLITTQDGKQRIPYVGIKSILISRGAQITSDAVLLAIEKEIEIIFADSQGNPMGRVWSPKYGSVSTIRKGQVNFTFTHDALTWIKDIILYKIANQQSMMLLMNANNDVPTSTINKQVNRLEDYRTKILNLDGDVVSDIAPTLRGWEGVASKIYFQTLNLFIPEQWRFTERSQYPAKDPVNALLNYGYGILYGKIEGALIKCGIDPYIGIMHRDNYNRPVLVYDIIERYRIWIEYVVYNLICQRVVNSDFYSVRPDKSCWLEAFGRRVLIQSVNDYMDEIINNHGTQRSRNEQIRLYAQSLAQLFKKYDDN